MLLLLKPLLMASDNTGWEWKFPILSLPNAVQQPYYHKNSSFHRFSLNLNYLITEGKKQPSSSLSVT